MIECVSEFTIGFVDRPQQPGKTGRFVDGPEATEGWPEEFDIPGREQSYCNDPFVSHTSS